MLNAAFKVFEAVVVFHLSYFVDIVEMVILH